MKYRKGSSELSGSRCEVMQSTNYAGRFFLKEEERLVPRVCGLGALISIEEALGSAPRIRRKGVGRACSGPSLVG